MNTSESSDSSWKAAETLILLSVIVSIHLPHPRRALASTQVEQANRRSYWGSRTWHAATTCSSSVLQLSLCIINVWRRNCSAESSPLPNAPLNSYAYSSWISEWGTVCTPKISETVLRQPQRSDNLQKWSLQEGSLLVPQASRRPSIRMTQKVHQRPDWQGNIAYSSWGINQYNLHTSFIRS